MSGPDSDSTGLIARAVQRLARRLRAARPENSVNLSTLALLSTLMRNGPMPAASLARAERLQPQSLTRLLAAMDEDGLIVREPHPVDRRVLVIDITKKGRGVVVRDMAARRAWLDQALDLALTAGERAQLAEAAALMMKVAGEEPDAPRAFRRIAGSATAHPGASAVIPGVYYDNARAAAEWLQAVLGFEMVEAYEGPGGKLAFAQMSFCGGMVFISTKSKSSAWAAAGTSAICLVSPDREDVKQRFETARAAGADFIRELHLSVSPAFPEGVQQFDVRDPEGHMWTVSEFRPGRSA